MKVATFDMQMSVPGTQHVVEGGVLRIFSDAHEVGRLSLVPVIDGKALEITSWESKDRQIVGHTRSGGSVHVAGKGDYLAYWVEGNFNTVESVSYFSGSTLQADCCHGFVSDWADRAFEMTEEIDIVASSSAPPAAVVGLAQRRRGHTSWTTTPAPRSIAFRSGNKWWGICIPGALPVGETHIRLRPGRFSIDLCHYVASNTRGNLPTAFIATDLESPYDLLDVDVQLCRERKELGGRKTHRAWWSKPIFCTWGEQVRAANVDKAPLTADNVRRWVKLLRDKTGVGDFTVAIDLPWFDLYGDFQASRARFGGTDGMRNLIDELHHAGHRVLLWYTPFKIDFDSDTAITQPDCLLQDITGIPIRLDTKSGCRDYTSAVARNTMLNDLRYILSDAERCLGADGLKLDLTHQCPDLATCRLKNARWGAGDEHWASLLRHIHEDAHRFKPDCLVTSSGMVPYLDKHTDMARLCHLLDHDVAKWFKRARIGLRLMPGTVIGAGGWAMTQRKYPAWWMTSPVFAVPMLYHATMFDGGRKISRSDYRRLSATWHVYANAPIEPDMEIVVEPETDTFYRKYTKGPLAGSYAAISFERTCLASFSPGCARVTAVRETEIDLPVPKTPRTLEAVRHDGTREARQIISKGKHVLLTVPDAATEVKYLELTF
ncbi:MAG: hypothetical protein HQ592_16085 [Planctomycetes bacterium]|nr:hypothetical protein [Planctomycetota bacterium]